LLSTRRFLRAFPFFLVCAMLDEKTSARGIASPPPSFLSFDIRHSSVRTSEWCQSFFHPLPRKWHFLELNPLPCPKPIFTLLPILRRLRGHLFVILRCVCEALPPNVRLRRLVSVHHRPNAELGALFFSLRLSQLYRGSVERCSIPEGCAMLVRFLCTNPHLMSTCFSAA